MNRSQENCLYCNYLNPTSDGKGGMLIYYY